MRSKDEINDIDITFGAEHDVARLQVAVCNALAMHVIETHGAQIYNLN